MKKILSFLPAILFAGFMMAADVTDVLNNAFTGVSGTTYKEWSGKQATSEAVYAGQCAGGNSSIQLRSSNNNAGVVTTGSGGTLKSITVKFNSGTADARTLDVYASNTAYSAATDLYGAGAGTKVVSFKKSDGAEQSYTFTDTYEYIGFRSASGALYLDEADIVWTVSGGGDAQTDSAQLAQIVAEATLLQEYLEKYGASYSDLDDAITSGKNALESGSGMTISLALAYAKENYDTWATNAFTYAKGVVKDQLNGLALETDEENCTECAGIISNAKTSVENVNWDSSKSVKTNLAALDAIYNAAVADLKAARPLADPTTCAEAAAILAEYENNVLYNNGKEYTLRGYVTKIADAWSSQYSNISFWMADTKDGGQVLEVYRAACASAADAPNEGDLVEVTGKLKRYNSTPEFDAGCTFTILERTGEVILPVNLGNKTIAEFLELKNDKDTCVLTGIVSNITNSTNGRFDLVEIGNAEVKVYVYNLLTADGQTQQFANMGIEEGDTLTINAVYLNYEGTPEAKNAVFVSLVKAVSDTPEPPVVTYQTLYLNTGGAELWGKDAPDFYIHSWGGAAEADVKMALVEGDVYSAEIPADNTTINFVRQEAGSDALDWSKVYNQTENLTIPEGKDLYSITGWYSGEWFNYGETPIEPETTYTVAGEPAAVFGAEWDATATVNDMTMSVDGGLYEWSKSNVALEAGAIEFKVAQNHDINVSYPSSNYKLNIAEAGTYDIEILFDANTKEVLAEATKKGGDTPGPDQPTNSYTIVFKETGTDSDSSTKRTTVEEIIESGATYVSAISNPSNIYNARTGRGIKLGTSKAIGALTLDLASPVKVSSIVVNAMWYKDGEATLKIQDNEDYELTGTFADYTYTYETPTEISSITLASTKLRNYIKSVTVNVANSGEEPPVAKDVTMYFVNTLGWESVNAYVFDADNNVYQDWPGEAMTRMRAADVYSYTFPASYTNIIFNNGTDQTADLEWDEQSPYFAAGEKNNDGKYEGTWYAEVPEPVAQPKFYITGDSALVVDAGLEKDQAWQANAIKSMAVSYKLNLKANQAYKLKITLDGTWNDGMVKGFGALTTVADGLTTDDDENICFTLNEAGEVNVHYDGEYFFLNGDFYVAPVEVNYYMKNNWNGADEWSWKEMAKADGYYALENVVFGGSGVNLYTSEDDQNAPFIEAKDIEAFDQSYNPAVLGALDTVAFYFDPEQVNQYTGANGLTAFIIGKYVKPEEPEVKTKDLKFVPTVWLNDDAVLAAWAWGDNAEGAWYQFESELGGEYQVAKINEKADSVIFVRFMAGESIDWNSTIWNRTGNEKISDCGIFYVNTWDQYSWCEPEATSIILYVINKLGWERIFAYIWNEFGVYAEWPGIELTKVNSAAARGKVPAQFADGDNIYSFECPKQYTNIVFNNNADQQTVDYVWVAEKPYFVLTGNMSGEKYDGYWQADSATGIENLFDDVKAVKVMVDGQMYILKGGKIYNVTGQVVK